MTAPPAIAMTSSDDPFFVNLPRSAIASGHIAGHISEQPSAISEINHIDKWLGASGTTTDPIIAIIEHIFSADDWLMYFGMKINPQM